MTLGPFRWHDWLLLAVVVALLVGVVTHARPTAITLSQADAGGTYADTTYVIAQINYAAYALAIVVAALLLHVALLRRASPTIAACGAIAIVLLILGLTLTAYPQAVLGRAGMPRHYIDYPDAFHRLWVLSRLGGALSFAAFSTLIGLTLRALHKRRRS